jgi:hypothetical protein
MALAAAKVLQFALQAGVILREAKDLTHEAWDTLNRKGDSKSYEGFLAPLGMTPENEI